MGIPDTSPNDPIFYLHHRNVDRIWANWQKRHPELATQYTGERWDNAKFQYVPVSPEDMMTFGNIGEQMAVKDSFNTKSGAQGLMCFEYSNSITPVEAALIKRDLSKRSGGGRSGSVTPARGDRTELFKIRLPSEIPTEALKKWKYTDAEIARVRKFDEKVAQFTEFVNRMPIVFSTSLVRQQCGQTKGWKPKTDEQAAREDRFCGNLVDVFEAQSGKT